MKNSKKSIKGRKLFQKNTKTWEKVAEKNNRNFRFESIDFEKKVKIEKFLWSDSKD